MKFLVPNYSCLQNPWLGGRGLPPPDPVLCPQLYLLNPPPHPNKIAVYATATPSRGSAKAQEFPFKL